MSRQNRLIYEFGPFRLVPAEKQLLRDGRAVPLTPKSFDLLVTLVENAGHLVEKGELMSRVWPDSFVEEANLSVKMSELRRALGEGASENQYIETVPRRGYRFVAEVTERPASRAVSDDQGDVETRVTEEEIAPDPDQTSSPAPLAMGLLRRFWPVAAVAVIFVIAALLVATKVGDMRGRLSAPTDAAPIRSLAVLPLENLSGDAAQDYFADGMTEALISDLGKIEELRVISRPSVMQYKGSRRPPSEISRELNVEALLTGSVVRAGDRVRIFVHLIDIANGQNLWTHSYERDLRDVLALQDEVTRDIIARIRIKLQPPDQDKFRTAAPVVPEAYDHYLRGKFYLHRQTREDNEAAIAALENAVAADPTFAGAHAELAQAYVWKLFLFDPEQERKWSEKAFLASEKALALDPDLAVAYLARGRLLWTPTNHFPHDKAIQEYRKALARDPNLDEARNQLALVLNHIGAFEQALQELERAVATNPGNSLARFRIGETFLFQGRYEEALSSLRGVPNQANPALVGHQIVWALFNLGRTDEAASTLAQFVRDHPNENRALLTSIEAVMAASAGRKDEAKELIEAAKAKGQGFGHFHHTAYHIACAYARMGEPLEAIKWLETAAADGFPCYKLFIRDTNLDNLRSDPRFQAFLDAQKRQWESYQPLL